jgi:hypothetical protein
MRHILPVVVLAMIVLILPHGFGETFVLGILLVVSAISLVRVFRS